MDKIWLIERHEGYAEMLIMTAERKEIDNKSYLRGGLQQQTLLQVYQEWMAPQAPSGLSRLETSGRCSYEARGSSGHVELTIL